jgi:hypothetical protein
MKMKRLDYRFLLLGLVLLCTLLFTCSDPLDNNTANISGENESAGDRAASTIPRVYYTIYNPTYPELILDVVMEVTGVPGWSDNDWEIEFYCNYVIYKAYALYGCKLKLCDLEQEYTHKVIRGKGDPKRVAPKILLEVRADSYFGFSGFKINGIKCNIKREIELPAVWQHVVYQTYPGGNGSIQYKILRVYNMPGWCDGKWQMGITFSGTVNEIHEVRGRGIYKWEFRGGALNIWGKGEPEEIYIWTDYDYRYCSKFRRVSLNGETLYVDIYDNDWWHDEWGNCW